MITMVVVTCVVFLCALLYVGLSIVWWLLVAAVKLALVLVGALLTVGTVSETTSLTVPAGRVIIHDLQNAQ